MVWQLLVLGVLTGIASGMFGVGGGIVMVPSLVLYFGLSMKEASATSLMAMVLPVGALGLWSHYKASVLQPQHIQWGLLLGAGIFVGTFFGSKLLQAVPGHIAGKAFSCLLIYAAYRVWSQSS